MIVITYFLIYGIGFFIDKMSAKNIVFGVTLPTKYLNDSKVKQIKNMFYKRYALLVGLPMLVLIALELRAYSMWFFMVFTGLWLLMTGLLFVYTHKKVSAFKERNLVKINDKPKVKSASLTNREIEMPAVKNYFFFALVIIIATAMITYIQYDKMPDQVAMHYNSLGEITRFADKSPMVAAFMIIIQVLLTALLYGSTYFSVKYSKRKLNPKKPETSAIQHKIAMKRYAFLMASVAILINVMFTAIQLSMIGLYDFNQTLSYVVTFAPLVLILIAMIWFFSTTGITGDKVKVDFEEESLDVQVDDNEDAYWKGGLFYYNKDDSSIFVPKRFGGGFTVNIGNPIGKLILFGILLIILLGTLIPIIYTK
jgi:uncharacterized membrane protein